VAFQGDGGADFHEGGDDDFVAPLEKRLDLLQRIRSEIKRHEEAFLTILAHHHVFTRNGNSSPSSNRGVTNNKFPQPASLLMVTSVGSRERVEFSVAQEHRSSRLNNMPRFLPGFCTRRILRKGAKGQSILTDLTGCQLAQAA
jgi:hypothetical protein